MIGQPRFGTKAAVMASTAGLDTWLLGPARRANPSLWSAGEQTVGLIPDLLLPLPSQKWLGGRRGEKRPERTGPGVSGIFSAAKDRARPRPWPRFLPACPLPPPRSTEPAAAAPRFAPAWGPWRGRRGERGMGGVGVGRLLSRSSRWLRRPQSAAGPGAGRRQRRDRGGASPGPARLAD